MIELKLAKKILKILLSTGGDFSEIFAQGRNLNSLRFEDGKIENASSGFELGCGLRLIKNESTFYAYVDSLSKEKLLNAAKVLSSAVCESPAIKVIDLRKVKIGYSAEVKRFPSEVLQSEKSSILSCANLAARNYDEKVIQVAVTLSDMEEETFIANSLQDYVSDRNVKVFMAVHVVAKKGGEIRTGYTSLARTCGYEIFSDFKSEELALKASKMAVVMLDATGAPAGSFPVVIGPAFGGVIFHEACGHGLEADSIIKDASVFKDKIDKKIASDPVTAVDDSSMPNHWGSYAVDGEGHPSQKNILIEDGILKNYIFDYKSAKKMKMKQTGNGRRQSYREIPLPRMSNTYITCGKEDPQSIISSVTSGIFAKEFSGGQVDPATGDFVFGISEGYLIKNGTLSEPIKGATLIGNGPAILKKIEAVGNNLDFAPGFCGKAGQSISNEVGQPTILVSEITVGGTRV
ncbi:MAG: TldD/PmbA family protein [Actinobacteria bacterium]|nr:TldD/PmbA family protein [Actinomycetota bacterium]